MTEISKTTDQAISVLEAVAQHGPINTASVARALGSKRTAIVRALETLRARGYVQRIEDGYILGPALFSISKHAEAAFALAARPVLNQLAETIGETVVFVMRDGYEAVTVEQAVRSDQMVHLKFNQEFRHPLHLGASGLSILAFLDDDNIARALQRANNHEEVMERLPGIKKDGYALTSKELVRGAHGVSVPVHVNQRVVGSVGVVASSTLTERLEVIVPALLEVSTQISSGFIVE